MPLFEPILAALAARDVRFVIVGGVAVVLHGYPRLTADLDLAIDLSPGPARATLEALGDLGLVPLMPVDAMGFADPQVRRQWVEDRNMVVFTLHDPADPLRQVDLFADNPLPFELLWERSQEIDLGSLSVRVASLDDLISMKRAAGRPLDLVDIEALEVISRRRRRS